MMATNLENDRLNIRIEIKNNIPEPMDTDEFEGNKSEEEGEIRDNSNSLNDMVHIQDKKNVREDMSRYIDLDQKKLQDRAIRFSLKPNETNSFTDDDLNELYISLGINSENIDQIRLDAVHLRSSDELTLKNVTTYFMNYAPKAVEMIDEESYNIVWENKFSAARALFLTSQVVRGMPVRVLSEHVIDSFILEDQYSNKEGIMINENRQIELTDDSTEEYKKLINSDSVDISSINIPIPPGYWRLGKEHINSFSVLLRFSMVTDKKPQLVEKCNKYFGNLFSKDQFQLHNRGIFSRNKDINSDPVNKDPWGILAKTWNEDYKFREPERYEDTEILEDELPPPAPLNPELRVRLAAKRRLGKKEEEEEIKQSSSEKEQTEESDQENRKKVSKVPRMRMYADEEEEKIKRRKLLHTLKRQTEKIEKTEIANTDLRNILRITNRKTKMRASIDDEIDLSLNLKNRRNKLVFTVAQDASNQRSEHLMRDRLERKPVRERQPRSPIRFKRNSPERIDRLHREPSEKYQRNSNRRQDRRISGGELYSTREDNDNYYSHKPRSKVALVIKTQKKPTVASTVRPRNRNYDTTSSESENDSSSSESEESSEESDSSSSEDSNSSSEHLKSRRSNTGPLKSRVKKEYERK